MKKTPKSKGYEAVPASIAVPLTLQPAIEPNGKALHYTSASSLTFTLNDIIAKTQETLSACSQFISERNYGKFRIMVQEQPLLLENDWVREQLHRYRKRTNTTRGRPAGSRTINQNLILGFVNAAIHTKQAHNKEQAFHVVSDFLGIDYDVVKRRFYNAIELSSNQAVFFERAPAIRITESEMTSIITQHKPVD